MAGVGGTGDREGLRTELLLDPAEVLGIEKRAGGGGSKRDASVVGGRGIGSVEDDQAARMRLESVDGPELLLCCAVNGN